MSAFYRENAQITTSENKVTIPCTDSRDPIKSLSWIFNHNETIYNSTGSERFYNENWSSYVDKNSAFTSLILKNLTKAQQGLFSCDLRTDSGTSVRNTLLNLHSESALSAGYIIGAAVVVFFIAVLWKVFCMRKKVK